jgi:hypothetical protein
MIKIIVILFLVYCSICFIIGIIQYIKSPKPPNNFTFKERYNYYLRNEWQLTDEETEIEDLHENERIMLLDETIVKYNKLLDNLTEQYNYTLDEKKRAVILSKQIATMEKLNRALEKREKLE